MGPRKKPGGPLSHVWQAALRVSVALVRAPDVVVGLEERHERYEQAGLHHGEAARRGDNRGTEHPGVPRPAREHAGAASRTVADADRTALERLAAAYLAEHLDFEDAQIRFDVVSMLIVGESRALLRNHLNALGTL